MKLNSAPAIAPVAGYVPWRQPYVVSAMTRLLTGEVGGSDPRGMSSGRHEERQVYLSNAALTGVQFA